ncbi:hypothetical protein HYFRA_00005299 [Hymenoscyphus fraxineus]|uniref:Uncharacterized protein n=1 Tax=Hymenoscyphus fraxineus TaxID=746836 RepID=A0A9N9L895_9HELO|nr:hypothetical protein HYFRA_00005299 [Hymenoscyphus fraxineus]
MAPRPFGTLLGLLALELFWMVIEEYYLETSSDPAAALLALFRAAILLPKEDILRQRVFAIFFKRNKFVIDKNNVLKFEATPTHLTALVQNAVFDLRLYTCKATFCVESGYSCVCHNLAVMVQSPLRGVSLQNFKSLRHLTIEALNVDMGYDLVTPLVKRLVSHLRLETVSLQFQMVPETRLEVNGGLFYYHLFSFEFDELINTLDDMFDGDILGECSLGSMKLMDSWSMRDLYLRSQYRHHYEEPDSTWIWRADPGRFLEIKEEE